ncbi:unnamed protein product [Urochloa humidicola]
MVCCGGNEDLDMLIALVTYSFTAMGSSIGIVVGTLQGHRRWLGNLAESGVPRHGRADHHAVRCQYHDS